MLELHTTPCYNNQQTSYNNNVFHTNDYVPVCLTCMYINTVCRIYTHSSEAMEEFRDMDLGDRS